jgi:NADPH:quinone reductase-like Zn-dependent oxidoreductase
VSVAMDASSPWGPAPAGSRRGRAGHPGTRDRAAVVGFPHFARTRQATLSYVFDPLGGGDWKKGYGLLRESGMLVCYGMANAAQAGKRNLLRAARTMLAVPRFNAFRMLGENKAVAGLNLGHLWHRAELLRPELLELVRLYTEAKIAPHIDSTYPFEKAAEAHARIELGKNLGKVLLVP